MRGMLGSGQQVAVLQLLPLFLRSRAHRVAGFDVFLTTDRTSRINRTWPAGPLPSSSSAFSSGRHFNRTLRGS